MSCERGTNGFYNFLLRFVKGKLIRTRLGRGVAANGRKVLVRARITGQRASISKLQIQAGEGKRKREREREREMFPFSWDKDRQIQRDDVIKKGCRPIATFIAF